MRCALAGVALIAACAGPRAPEPEPVAAVTPAEIRHVPPRCPHAAAIAERLLGICLESLTADWPRRSDLPKPEECYGVASVTGVPAMCDGWSFDVLVDHERPGAFWVRATGTIAGIREYRGPAEVVDDKGSPAFRVLE